MEPVVPPSAHPATVPVVEEKIELATTTEQVGALRVRVEDQQAAERIDLEHIAHGFETVRVPRGIPVAQPRAPWTEGDVLVVPVYEEVAVVQRQLVLKEEIRLMPRQHHTTQQVSVPVRRERAVVERQQADGTWKAVECGNAHLQTGRKGTGS